MSDKRKAESDDESLVENVTEDDIAPDDESPDALSAPKPDKTPRPKLFKGAKNHEKRLIVILEQANLEIVKIGSRFELLNCDDHMTQIRKHKKDPAFCRPDITHQVIKIIFEKHSR